MAEASVTETAELVELSVGWLPPWHTKTKVKPSLTGMDTGRKTMLADKGR